MCPICFMENGLHEQGCEALEQGWAELTKPASDFCRAIEQRGYQVILAVGFGQRPDGDYSVKVAAHGVLRQLDPATWHMLKTRIAEALAQVYDKPLDDLEWES